MNVSSCICSETVLLQWIDQKAMTRRALSMGRAVLALAMVLFSKCGWAQALPDAYGAYVQLGGAWVRLEPAKSLIEREVGPDVRFLIHDKRLGIVQDGGFRIVRNKFVRNIIEQDPDEKNRVTKAENKWTDDASDRVAFSVYAVKDRPEMVIIKPDSSMKDGVYGLRNIDRALESIFVGGRAVFTPAGRERHCVDRVVTSVMGMRLSNVVPEQLVPCGSASVTASIQGTGGQSGGATLASPEIPLNPNWLGVWKSSDSKKTIVIQSSRMEITDLSDGKSWKFSLKYIPRAGESPAQESFQYMGKSKSLSEIRAEYEESVSQYRKDPTDFSVGNIVRAREDLSQVKAGRYRMLSGYHGGDCAIWEWINDGELLLEISRCKYAHRITLFRKSG